VGIKAIDKLGIKTEKDLWAFKDKNFVIGENLIKYLNDNKEMVKELLAFMRIKVEKEKDKNAKHISMTGSGIKSRNELIQDIGTKGDIFDSSPNKSTNILLVEDVNSGSSKILKAQKLGIKIMRYDEYFK
jgi:NAD-dependent DNA ligase